MSDSGDVEIIEVWKIKVALYRISSNRKLLQIKKLGVIGPTSKQRLGLKLKSGPGPPTPLLTHLYVYLAATLMQRPSESVKIFHQILEL